MPIVSFICILIFLIFFISGLRRNTEILSPSRVFGIVWALVIGLVELKFSGLQFQWSSFDWLIVLLGLVAFFLGTYFSFILNFDKRFLHISEIREKIRNLRIEENKLFFFIVVYFFLWLICFLTEWWIVGYLPIFTSQPSARINFKVFGINYIVNSVNVILFLVLQYLTLIKGNSGRKIFLSIIFIISMGNYILIMQRYGLFLFLLMAFSFYCYAGKKIKIRTIIIFGLLIIGMVFGIALLRESEVVIGFMVLNAKTKLPHQYSGLVLPYMYVSMNLENFVRYYSCVTNYSYGFHTFGFLLDSIGIGHWMAEYFNFTKFRMNIGGYNTYPFFWAYFLDFGITGLVVIPMMIGFFFSEVYYTLHRNPTLAVLALNAIVFAVIVISYSSDPLTRLDAMLPFIIIVLVQFSLIQKKEVV